MLGLLIAGCASPADTFFDARADAVCARHARCDTLAAAGFDDEAGCVRALREAARLAGDCEGFDEGAADACLATWDVACEEVPDVAVCDDVCR